MAEVTVQRKPAQSTLVVGAVTTWSEFPRLWPRLSGEVWACLRAAGVERGCRNVMLYRDDVPHVEVGVLFDGGCPLSGQVVASHLPAGRVATSVHRGAFDGLGAAHQAVAAWCAAHGETPAGPRWEVYGPHKPDPADQWTEISWLLAEEPANR